MKRGLFKKLGVGVAVAAFCGSGVLMAMAGGSVITAGGTVTTEKLADGIVLTTEKGAKSAKGNQNLYTVTYDYDDPNYDLVLGGPLHGKPTLSTMAKTVDAMDNCTVLAGANADFFDMSGTGVPMGMSMENGRIVESPVADRAAEGYQYHALGITRDGKVLAGYNPTLVSTYQLKGADDADREPIDFINRNRTPGVNIVLYTEDFGASTYTKKDTQGSYEVRLQIRSGAVSPQANPLVATVEAVSEEGNMAINKNTVVLSAQGTRMSDLKKLKIGDTLEMNFSFVEEEWNDVDFAIGGAYAFVQNGKAMDTDYGDESNPDMDGPAFTAVNPRTSLGITKEGKIVLLVTDGRGAGGGTGFDAKELAHYMAEDMGCEFAILLDGGGSSEMVGGNG